MVVCAQWSVSCFFSVHTNNKELIQYETFNTIYRQWQDFRDRLYKWNRVSSLSYGQFAFKNV